MIIHCAIGYRAERKKEVMTYYAHIILPLLTIAAFLIGYVVGALCGKG